MKYSSESLKTEIKTIQVKQCILKKVCKDWEKILKGMDKKEISDRYKKSDIQIRSKGRNPSKEQKEDSNKQRAVNMLHLLITECELKKKREEERLEELKNRYIKEV